MDTNKLISRLKSQLPGAVLDSRPFGQSGVRSLWVEMRTLAKLAELLSQDEDCHFDWLEGLSVMEIDQALVLSYFLRSSKTDAECVLRGTVLPPAPDEEVEVPSVTSVWTMAGSMEDEARELFGIRFSGRHEAGRPAERKLLPEGWKGYPLRKSYVFPKEHDGIAHSRGGPSAPAVNSGEAR